MRARAVVAVCLWMAAEARAEEPGSELPPAPGVAAPDSVEEVLARFAHEPPVAQVQRWAAAHAQVEPGRVQRWLAASRRFAALPQLRLEYRQRDDYGNGFSYFTDAGPVGTASDRDRATAVQTDADVGQDRTLVVRATWDLDELVMSSEQIRVLDQLQDVVKLREQVLGEVTRLYFERRRLQVESLLAPSVDLAGRVRDAVRLEELTAAVDAFTGGRFAGAIAP